MGTIKNARRKTKWDRTQADLQGSRDYSKHLLERITIIENAINWMLKPKCDCGSREVMNTGSIVQIVTGTEINQSYGIADYTFGEIRCFHCHRLLEAYGVRG